MKSSNLESSNSTGAKLTNLLILYCLLTYFVAFGAHYRPFEPYLAASTEEQQRNCAQYGLCLALLFSVLMFTGYLAGEFHSFLISSRAASLVARTTFCVLAENSLLVTGISSF
uniref:Uncharacterized protein n=1 Tax=Opuntia streptacantha TaxID=393608 RepID=A0A7C9CP63_OPUST